MTKQYEIEDYLVSEYTFERMKSDLNSDSNMSHILKISESYSTFLKWNITCINELSDKDREWLTGLCNRIGNKKINLMDEESCVAFEAYKIYFDEDKKICLVNPR
jgi:hypothetical protein